MDSSDPEVIRMMNTAADIFRKEGFLTTSPSYIQKKANVRTRNLFRDNISIAARLNEKVLADLDERLSPDMFRAMLEMSDSFAVAYDVFDRMTGREARDWWKEILLVRRMLDDVKARYPRRREEFYQYFERMSRFLFEMFHEGSHDEERAKMMSESVFRLYLSVIQEGAIFFYDHSILTARRKVLLDTIYRCWISCLPSRVPVDPNPPPFLK